MSSVRRPRFRMSLRQGLIFAAIVIVCATAWISIEIASGELPWKAKADPRFIVTKVRRMEAGPSATITERLFIFWINLRQRISPSSASYTFSATQPSLSSVEGLLSQCTEMTGMRYYIARELSGAVVMFGNTNALSGTQWSQACTAALQTGQPEWFDQKTQKFRRENLVLITNNSKMVYVVPAEMAAELR